MKNNTKENVKKFISYCQKHPVDNHIITKYDNDIFKSSDVMSILGGSDKYQYQYIDYDNSSYIFRIKDFLSLNEINSRSFVPEKTLLADCLFDYENNEIETIINGHRIKSILYEYENGRHAYDSFDEETHYAIMHIRADNISIHHNIMNIIDIKTKLYSDDWNILFDAPKELDEVITTQKIMLAMAGE